MSLRSPAQAEVGSVQQLEISLTQEWQIQWGEECSDDTPISQEVWLLSLWVDFLILPLLKHRNSHHDPATGLGDLWMEASYVNILPCRPCLPGTVAVGALWMLDGRLGHGDAYQSLQGVIAVHVPTYDLAQ